MSDNFDNPANGWLPSSSGRTEYALEYAGGEYAVRLADLQYNSIPAALLPGTYRDTSLAVDARLIGDVSERYIALTCRVSSAGQYIAYVVPSTRFVHLARLGGETSMRLAQQPAESMRRDNAMNRLELSCIGRNISVSINGALVVSVEDDTLQEGRIWIGASAPGTGRPVEARFDNLVLTER
jgi:hypothetical protein